MASDPPTPRSHESESEIDEPAPAVIEAAPTRRPPFLIDPRHLTADLILGCSSQQSSTQPIPPAASSAPPLPVDYPPSAGGPIRPKQKRGPRGPYKKKDPNAAGAHYHYHTTNNLNFHPDMDVEKMLVVLRAMKQHSPNDPSQQQK